MIINPFNLSKPEIDKILKRPDIKDGTNIDLSMLVHNENFINRMLFETSYEEYSKVLYKYNNEIIDTIYNSRDYNNFYMMVFNYPNFIFDNFEYILSFPAFPKALDAILFSPILVKCINFYPDMLINKLETSLEQNSYSYTLFLILCRFFEVINLEYVNKNEERLLTILEKLMDLNLPNSISRDDCDDISDVLNGLGKAAKKSELINSFLENKEDYIISLFTGLSKETLVKNNLYDFFKLAIDDVKKMEGTGFESMKAGNGGTSTTLIIGNKVLKTGYEKLQKIPYDKRILQPIIRQNLDFYNADSNPMFLEAYEKVDTKDISQEDAYKIFKELLDRNILLADPKPLNMGRLIKANKVHLKGASYKEKEDYFVEDSDVKILFSNKEKEVLEEGKIVVNDLQYIYDISGFDVKEFIKKDNKNSNDVVNEFMKRFDVQILDYHGYMSRYVDELKEDLAKKSK